MPDDGPIDLEDLIIIVYSTLDDTLKRAGIVSEHQAAKASPVVMNSLYVYRLPFL
ncbi:MAG: hypothetical protein LBV15_02775 [Planctomycetota bacterium]|nr:hypothetical protein [Planctomycetota bacterium]